MMKLTIFFLIVVCLHVSAAGYGQNGTVTISGKDLPLEKVFSVIKKQTDYVCFYGSLNLKDAKPVSLSFKDADVQEVLKAALWGQGLDFSITGKTITIMKKVVTTAAPSAGPGRTVKAVGVVYNDAGQPLSGANVTIKATGKGTITNARGEFELPAVPEESPLVISFIGYAPQVMKVSEGTSMQVYLTVAKNELDKVVVQAYGTTTQRLATGSIATVTAEQIERQPVINPLAALQGQVPGLVVTQLNGYASAPFKIEIRGRSGINENLPSEPLYIIDGVPLTVLEAGLGIGGNYASGSKGFLQNGFSGPAGGQSPFFSINPSDIESITVLKDGDATAIYGSRGANGVIIITTKRGKPGKSKLDLNVYQGYSKVTNYYDMLNTQQYLKMREKAFQNDNIDMNAGNAYDLLVWDTTKYTNWQKKLWGGTGKTANIQLSLSGGDIRNTYRIAGSYVRQTDIMSISGADQRGSVEVTLGHKSVNQKLDLSFASMYSYSKSDLTYLASAVTLPPDAPDIFDTSNKLNYNGWVPAQDIFPFASLLQPYSSKTGFLNSSLDLRYEIVKGLQGIVNFGYSTYTNSQIRTTPITSQNPSSNPLGSSSFGNNIGSNSIIEPQINFNRTIAKGRLAVMIGGSFQFSNRDGNTIQANGYTNDNLLHSAAAASSTSASNGSGQYRYSAVFTRFTYDWDNTYVANVSARRDGSSRFGPGRQFGNFGSIGLAWIFSNYTWVKDNIKILSFAKLRGSYGVTGSDQIGDYQFLSAWGPGYFPYQQGGLVSYIPYYLSNPKLVWQSNKKLEVALTTNIIHDRIALEISRYQNRCGNQLIPFVLPALTGFTYVTANFPATVQNSGWELLFRGKIVDNSKLTWSINFNIGVNRNKLIAYPGIEQSPYASTLTVGKSLNIQRLLHYTGVDPKTGEYTFLDKNHNDTVDYSYNNGNNDLIDKDLNVRFDGGFGTDLVFKGWQLNIFFTFRKQQLRSAIANGYPGTISNQSTKVLNSWQSPGDKVPFARFTTNGTANDSYYWSLSDGIYSNGSYIRLRNVSLSYDPPIKWLNKIGVQTFKIYIRAENLLLITKYDGIDPDSPGFGSLPPSKIVTTGIQINL